MTPSGESIVITSASSPESCGTRGTRTSIVRTSPPSDPVNVRVTVPVWIGPNVTDVPDEWYTAASAVHDNPCPMPVTTRKAPPCFMTPVTSALTPAFTRTGPVERVIPSEVDVASA